jgi:hypothetical protein
MITVMREQTTQRERSSGEPHDEHGVIAEHALDVWRRVERMAADHPKPCLIAAATAGVILGWITKRR